jgi:cell division protein ZapE
MVLQIHKVYAVASDDATRQTTATMDLLSHYKAKISEQLIKPDDGQAHVAEQLNTLATALNKNPNQNPSFFKKLFGKTTKSSPRGLYIYGDVGRGKTMLMDLFFEHVEGWPKKRIHFHAFMQEVHRARGAQKTIEQIADDIARDAKLLCLDEMQIVDIADAMIIGRLFEAMHQRGVVMVTTANLPPDGLYKDGLNRDLFLPFIAKLNQELDIVSLQSSKDYRLGRVRAHKTYLSPATAENRVTFNSLWHDLTDGAMGKAEVLEVLGRKRYVPKAAHGCASFTFFELCGEALGPPDYLAIAAAYQTVFMSGVPKLKAHQRNETKRFILMIDTFYDAKTRLVILAEDKPENLFPKNQHAFESQRSVSRLQEMQSASWWGKTIVDT